MYMYADESVTEVECEHVQVAACVSESRGERVGYGRRERDSRGRADRQAERLTETESFE